MQTKDKIKSKEKECCSEIVAFFALNAITKKVYKMKDEAVKFEDEGILTMLENFEEDK